MARIIAHIDMDAFFASVEERDKPYLRGLPIAVGSDPEGGTGRGVVATANYPARAYGIHSALPIRRAWKLSEAAREAGKVPVTFIAPHMGKYERASRDVFSIIERTFPRVEHISIDEGYIDCSHLKSYTQARKVMAALKQQVKKEVGLTCSIGIAPSKMFAKIASEKEKPDGLVVLTPRFASTLLPTLPIGVIPGIGYKTQEVLARKKIKTVDDARKLSWEQLVDLFGSNGFTLYERIWGTDTREVATEVVDAKSIGRDETLRHDIHTFKEALPVIERTAKELYARMQDAGWASARTLTAVVRLSNFTTFTRRATPKEPIASVRALETIGMKLLLPSFDIRDNPRKQGIRLIGLRLEGLSKNA
jgi:DNA polymerase IV (DinB-like DNA polymerase)